MSADGWKIEVYGSQILDSQENIKQGKAPTKIKFFGQMVNVPNNPGKVMRNRYLANYFTTARIRVFDAQMGRFGVKWVEQKSG